MAETTKKFHCAVITPEAKIVDVDVKSVVFPAHDGLSGVLPGHAPMLCNLGMGILRYQDISGKEFSVYIENGFAHILDNEVTILTRHALTPEMIPSDKALAELAKAREMTADTIEAVSARNQAIQRAKYLQAIAKQ